MKFWFLLACVCLIPKTIAEVKHLLLDKCYSLSKDTSILLTCNNEIFTQNSDTINVYLWCSHTDCPDHIQPKEQQHFLLSNNSNSTIKLNLNLQSNDDKHTIDNDNQFVFIVDEFDCNNSYNEKERNYKQMKKSHETNNNSNKIRNRNKNKNFKKYSKNVQNGNKRPPNVHVFGQASSDENNNHDLRQLARLSGRRFLLQEQEGDGTEENGENSETGAEVTLVNTTAADNSGSSGGGGGDSKRYVYEICFGLFIAAIILTIYCVCLRFRKMHASFNEMTNGQGSGNTPGNKYNNNTNNKRNNNNPNYERVRNESGSAIPENDIINREEQSGSVAQKVYRFLFSRLESDNDGNNKNKNNNNYKAHDSSMDYVRLKDGSNNNKNGKNKNDSSTNGKDNNNDNGKNNGKNSKREIRDGMIDLKTVDHLNKGEYKLVRKLSKAKFDIKTKLVAHNHSHGSNIATSHIPQYNDIKHNMGVRLSTMTDLHEESSLLSRSSMSDGSNLKSRSNFHSSQTMVLSGGGGNRESFVSKSGEEASWIKYVGQGQPPEPSIQSMQSMNEH